LWDDIFANVDFHDNHIVVGDYDDRWVCRVSFGNGKERKAYFVKEPMMGARQTRRVYPTTTW
jgi:hypothetical protein